MYKAAVKLKKQGLPEHIIAKVTDLTLQQVKEL
jgi:hypothetical protein